LTAIVTVRHVLFRVLGPVEAHTADGRILTLPRRRERCLFAILLIEAGQVVTVDRLCALLWDDEPPAHAHQSLRSSASRIRSLLATIGTDGPGPALTSDRGGYRLTLAPDQVDAHRFRRLIDDAATATISERSRLLRQALTLWRGPVMHNAAGDQLRQRLGTGLEELRLHAVEEAAAADLELGRDRELIPELARLTAEHPHRERLIGQYMLALHRAGRTVEALDTYTSTRSRLAEQFGLDPGPALRDLHEAILRGTTPTAPAPAPAGPPADPLQPGAPTPAQLPTALARFVSRDTQITRLDAALHAFGSASSAAPMVVTGPPGVGKTALAVHWAHRVAGQFPDGQLYADLRGVDTVAAPAPTTVLRGFLEALGVAPGRIPSGLDTQAALYRSLLTRRRMIIVLDNAGNPGQVRPLLPGTPGCQVLVTSRDEFSGLVASHGAVPVALDVMSPAEAWQLLANRLGPERLDAEPQAAGEIILRCARLPLALAVAAARGAARAHFPLAVLAAQLRDTQDGLDAFAGGEACSDVRAVFSWSYCTLSPGAAALFRSFGLHPGPDVGVPAAASLAGLPQQTVRPLLDELTRAHLITEHQPGRYRFHDLLKVYAAEQARAHDSSADRRAARGRLLDHYLHSAYAATLLPRPGREAIEPDPPADGVTVLAFADLAATIAWHRAEHHVLLAAVQQAADLREDRRCWQLAWTLTDFLDRQGRSGELADVQHIALQAARRDGDRQAQALIHRNLARAYAQAGGLDQAESHLREAIALHAAVGDRIGEAGALDNLVSTYCLTGRFEQALHQSARAIALCRRLDHAPVLAAALNNAGWAAARLGRLDIALAHCQEALRLFRDLGPHDAEAAVSDSLGYIHHQLGRHHDAISYYHRALDLYARGDAPRGRGLTFSRLGDAHHADGDQQAAEQAWRQAVDLLDTIGHPAADEARVKLASRGVLQAHREQQTADPGQ
jgi:DNA-binding SARP family transcriptional activator/tetratricopeptide (TPR) repeat protein